MNFKLSLALVLITVTLASINNVGAEDLSLFISRAENQLVLNDDKLFVTVTIKNISKQYLEVPLLLHCENHYLRFEIYAKNDELAKFIGYEINWMNSPSDYLRMPPNSSFTQEVNLNDCYKVGPGNNRVQAIYEVKPYHRSEEGLWFGRIKSNKLLIDSSN